MANQGTQAGVRTARVVNNIDPTGGGRIEIAVATKSGKQRASVWARRATLSAGDRRGTWFLPEVGDEVLVAFEQGDAARPIVVGALWSAGAAPPESGPEQAERTTIRTRSGAVIRVDDAGTSAPPTITLDTGAGDTVRSDRRASRSAAPRPWSSRLRPRSSSPLPRSRPPRRRSSPPPRSLASPASCSARRSSPTASWRATTRRVSATSGSPQRGWRVDNQIAQEDTIGNDPPHDQNCQAFDIRLRCHRGDHARTRCRRCRIGGDGHDRADRHSFDGHRGGRNRGDSRGGFPCAVDRGVLPGRGRTRGGRLV